MIATITWLGHNCWSIRTGDHQLLLDPFLDDSPTAPCKAADVEADFILVSHGHFDHLADAAKIAVRTSATIIANFEVCQWFAQPGGVENPRPTVSKSIAMNIGGGVQLPFGRVKMTVAHHSSSLPDGTYGGNPGGFLLELNQGPKIYFACDTALTLDMKLLAPLGIDLAVLPIGDLFTMGPDDSIEAIKLIDPRRVAPCHYNTWPPIAQDVQQWAQRVQAQTDAEPIVLAPGESISL